MRWTFVFVISAILGGCVASEQQATAPNNAREIPVYDPSNPEPWCSSAIQIAQNPWLTEVQLQILLTAIQNRGCLN